MPGGIEIASKIVTGITILVMILSSAAAIGWDSSDAVVLQNIDVFMLAGQSNAAYSYRADAATADPVCSPGQAYYYGDSTSPVAYADWDESATYGIYDMVESDGTAHIGGIEQPFAATYCEETGNKICIINVAVGGSRISEWSVNQTYYVWAQSVFQDAMDKIVAAGFSPDVKGLIWMQGESDPSWPIEAYKNRFIAMFNSMTHSDDTNGLFNDTYAFENCIMSLVRQHRGQNTCLSQIQLDAENDDVKLGCIVCDTFTYENGLLYSDDTHYTQLGRNIVAADLAENYIKLFS